MHRILLCFIAAVIFTFTAIYVTNTVSPWNIDNLELVIERNEIETGTEFSEYIYELKERGLVWEVINKPNLALWLGLWAGSIISTFSFAHMSIDKLFFKRFFEQPNLFRALRRGTWLYATTVAWLLLKLFAGGNWLNTVSIAVFFIALEGLLIHWLDPRLSALNKKNTSNRAN